MSGLENMCEGNAGRRMAHWQHRRQEFSSSIPNLTLAHLDSQQGAKDQKSLSGWSILSSSCAPVACAPSLKDNNLAPGSTVGVLPGHMLSEGECGKGSAQTPSASSCCSLSPGEVRSQGSLKRWKGLASPAEKSQQGLLDVNGYGLDRGRMCREHQKQDIGQGLLPWGFLQVIFAPLCKVFQKLQQICR